MIRTPRAQRSYAKAWRARKKARGECCRCGKPGASPYSHCTACRAYVSQLRKIYIQKARSKWQAAGKCYSCGKETELYKVCERCRDKRRKRGRYVRQKETAKRLKFGAYRPWSQLDEDMLLVMWKRNISQEDMADHFVRSLNAIRHRLDKLRRRQRKIHAKY